MEATSPQAETKAPAASQRGFWALVGLQAQTILTDHIFKFLLIMVVLAAYKEEREAAGFWLSAFMAICAVPSLLFAGWAGAVSDRQSRRSVLIGSKGVEIAALIIGGLALYFIVPGEKMRWWDFALAILSLFLLSTRYTFYGPSKYGILSDLVPPHQLIWGNGVVELATYAAVMVGIRAGTWFHDSLAGGHLWWAAIFLMLLALGGFIPAWMIDRVPPGQPDLKLSRNQFPALGRAMKLIFTDRVLLLIVMGIAYFWGLGALAVANAPFWGEHALGVAIDKHSPGLLVIPIVAGIGLGAWICGNLSKKGIELGFIPLGGLGMALFAFPLGIPETRILDSGPETAPAVLMTVMVVFLALMGFSAGFYYVSLNSWLQQRTERANRGGVLAASNFINFAAMLLGMAFYYVLKGAFQFTPSNIFAVCSIVTTGVTIFLVTLLPEVLLGMMTTVITRFIYRIKILGGENIPREGAALLVSNHVSIMDALLISALSPRPVRFIVWQELVDHPVIGYFLKIMKAIPVASDQRPRAMIASLTIAADALNNGELVCIFAEGQVTRPGLMLPFRRGFKHILGRAPVPVVPIYLEGVWGSIFSYERGKFLWNWPREFPYHVRAAVGKPLPSDVSPHNMRQSVLQLSADCAMAKRDHMKPVHHRFLNYARRHWRQFCVADSITNNKLSYMMVAVGAVVLARRFKRIWRGQEMIGIFLPPSNGGVLANIAVALAGKTAVNLNYTTGPEILRHCIRECNIKTVITSQLFLKKLEMEPPPGSLFLDEMMKKHPAKLTEKLLGMLAFHFLPTRLLEGFCGAEKHPKVDDLFTVIFSSGSTGMPKGVMLTHFNIASNIDSMDQAVCLWSDDVLIGFLPFFHSFGYTAALWGALCIGFGVVHHANPLEAKQIGDLVEKYKVTVMIATPTFLQNYIRRVEPEKFASLEFILTGAEKLPLRIAEGFEERFGVYVHEGYGTTECAPIVSANVDDYRSRGFHSTTNKRGTVGHPFPGVVVRIVDLDTGQELPGGETGMIQVRGANIMKGYLNNPEKTAEVLKPGGWYETGDLGFIDDEGFIHITDRLARFSKIGGEMVPHVKIEEELHKAIGATEQVFAVTSVPDETKGERLVVLHTIDPIMLEGVNDKLAESGLPNLWIPRRTMYFRIDHIPVLGSGKLDLAEIRRTAARMVSEVPVGAGK